MLGDTRMPARFWKKVQIDSVTGCWLWTAARTAAGYGRYHVGGKGPTQRFRTAHRVAYETLIGDVPIGRELDHLCRVRHCVNPEHVEPVTHRENVLRGGGWSGTNARKTACPSGHPYDNDNTYWTPSGSRQCRTCKRARQRKEQR